ncbi:hypothetical protein CORC01_07149 [Colletotrichum orchidophilum]|uniref:DUF3669 domain-containing protein n=1 Tax=Colletotrichum orchidophilum TaxID=1209926 RepID=A0A1G4B824_9PEZI|nr:uncharacterized protein CORC01_07149 [Colletotrichum orchidophilum]OHE97534.1 hypothetical protein CORC01_07149 [Colletotrichum orchidophilum]
MPSKSPGSPTKIPCGQASKLPSESTTPSGKQPRLRYPKTAPQGKHNCLIPKFFPYAPKQSSWWDINEHISANETHESFDIPSGAIITERIPTLPETLRDAVARIYLGRRRASNTPPPRKFSLRNYNLSLDQMLELGMPDYNIDGYDFEFALGGIRQMVKQSSDDLVDSLITGFSKNGPYHPLPLVEDDENAERLWSVFSAAYVEEAG